MTGRICVCGSREYLGNLCAYLPLCYEANFFLKKKVLNYNKDVKQEGKRRIVCDECHAKVKKNAVPIPRSHGMRQVSLSCVLYKPSLHLSMFYHLPHSHSHLHQNKERGEGTTVRTSLVC